MSRQSEFHSLPPRPVAAALIALLGLAPQAALAAKTVTNCGPDDNLFHDGFNPSPGACD